MTEQTFLTFGKDRRIAEAGGSWSVPSSGGLAISKHSVKSIGYPILAASVSEELQTLIILIDVVDAGGAQTLTLRKSLPTTNMLISMINDAIAEAYSLYGLLLPQIIKRSDGWYLTNPTPDLVTLTLSNSNQQQLILGDSQPLSLDVVVQAGQEHGPFFPDSRLGAVSQSLVLHPGQSYTVELPLTGDYREGVLFRPMSENVELSAPVTTAEISVSFPSINSRLTMTATMPSQIAISSVPAIR